MKSALEIHEYGSGNILFTDESTNIDYTVPEFDLEKVAATFEYHVDYDASYHRPVTHTFSPKASELTSDEIESWLLENRKLWITL